MQHRRDIQYVERKWDSSIIAFDTCFHFHIAPLCKETVWCLLYIVSHSKLGHSIKGDNGLTFCCVAGGAYMGYKAD